MRRYRFRILSLLLVLYVCAMGFVLAMMGRSLTVEAALHPEPVVIVDAGHGGFDGGAEGQGGTIEKDINLPIALKLRDLLTVYGFQVIMTREEDVSTCDEGLSGIANKKTSDIMNRFALIKKHPDAIFLSIHQNKYPSSASWGAQMFYGPKSEQSKILAQMMQQNFSEMLQPENTREAKIGEQGVYLLYYSPVPSVLVECGFLSNPGDEALLVTEEYQNQIAFVIASSLLQYMEQGYYPQVRQEELSLS